MRGPPRREHLARRGHLPPSSVPLARPLQQPPATLLVPLPVPTRLRDQHTRRYAPVSGVTQPRVQEPGVGPHGAPPGPVRETGSISTTVPTSTAQPNPNTTTCAG